MGKEKQINEEELKENHKWARHYDQMLWLSTSIFLLVIAQLVLVTSAEPNIETALLGILITGCLLYFAASFRRHKHHHMKNLKEVQRPELSQWWIYTLLIFFVGIYWLYHIQKLGFEIIWLGLFWTLIVAILYHEGRYKN